MSCRLAWLLEWFNAVHVIKEYIRVIFAYLDYHKSFNISHEMPFNSSTLACLLGCVVLQMNVFVESWFVKTHYFLTCSVTAIALISRLTGILHVASEMLCSVWFLSLLPCLVVRITSCSVSTILTTVYACVFPYCNNRRLASGMLCNSLFT